MTDEVVTRLYRALVEELRRRDHPEGRPVKVSELYQKLVPYRSVRSTLGVELNADYEHALLRLLAGERDLLRLEPQQAREELRRETEAPYPFVGLFRKFSASNVWVAMPDEETAAAPPPAERVEAEPLPQAAAEDGRQPRDTRLDTRQPDAPAAPAPPERPVAPEPARVAADGRSVRLRGGGGADPAASAPPVQLHGAAQSEPAEALSRVGASCDFCDEELPSGRRVRFCPHCGGDQRLRPCPRCEAVLERDWRYCISCGAETGPS